MNLNSLYFSILSVVVCITTFAMEKPINPRIRYNIIYTITSPKADHWQLDGHNDDNRHIGIVKYNQQEKAKWRITKFEIEPEFRNSGFGYGTALFKRCFQEITRYSCTKITWTACPMDDTITREQLKDIYDRIIKKIHPDVPGKLMSRDTVLGTQMTYLPA